MAEAAQLVIHAPSFWILGVQGLCFFLRDALQHPAQLRDDHGLMLPVALLPCLHQGACTRAHNSLKTAKKKGLSSEVVLLCHEAWLTGGLGYTEGVPSLWGL